MVFYKESKGQTSGFTIWGQTEALRGSDLPKATDLVKS